MVLDFYFIHNIFKTLKFYFYFSGTKIYTLIFQKYMLVVLTCVNFWVFNCWICIVSLVVLVMYIRCLRKCPKKRMYLVGVGLL